MSFWFEAKKIADTGKRLKLDLPDPPGGRVGPYGLQAWATREGLEIIYIDNCYLKVPVGRDKLLAYLTALYGTQEPLPVALLSAFGPEWEFRIAAEEFWSLSTRVRSLQNLCGPESCGHRHRASATDPDVY